MFTALTVATLASHLGGPGFGFGFLLLFLIPLFFFGLFVLFASIGRRRWMRAGGFGPGYGHFGHGGWGSGARSAEATLAERFAQGDIDEKEYRARLEVLRASNPPVAR
ncbi:MAG: SHOCT domain-containing protein [Actinobacteria bacterium]|nr:SHOCT domain-containing protein [Actinomycetota bacterium]